METVVAMAQLGLTEHRHRLPTVDMGLAGPPSGWTRRVYVETQVVSSAVATGTWEPSSSQVLGCGRR